ncbi:MAG: protein-L-isoaspartate O-methyltransferase [Rhodocyclaceae bacterium]
MDFEQARFNMVEQQIRPWEVLDQEVLDLLFAVKREEFVPPVYRALAFADLEIPLGHGAEMLAPKVEAKLLQALKLRRSDKVLEVGAGSGYMAALMAARSDHVYTVEIVPDLAEMARANLARAGVENVTVEIGDASGGWPAHAPYDVIVVSGALAELPGELLGELKPGGRLAAFVGEPPVIEARLLTRRADGGLETVNLFETDVAALRNAPRANRFRF